MSKKSLKQLLSRRFSGKDLFLLITGVSICSMILLFFPFLRAMEQWYLQRTVSFEGDPIMLPKRWVLSGGGHLLSIKRQGATILFPYQTTIVIDPFAERWPADKIVLVSEQWLGLYGSPIAGRFKNPHTGNPIAFPQGMKCVSPASSSELRYVPIYCLSSNYVYSFEFLGERSAISDFAEVSAQALRIASKHPGIVWRK